jgi:hypothetical protein
MGEHNHEPEHEHDHEHKHENGEWLPGIGSVLDIGGDVGALVLYTDERHLGREIEICPIGDESRRVHTAIHERRVGERRLYAGVYPELPAGNYRIWIDDPALPDTVTIVGGEVAEMDWRADRD